MHVFLWAWAFELLQCKNEQSVHSWWLIRWCHICTHDWKWNSSTSSKYKTSYIWGLICAYSVPPVSVEKFVLTWSKSAFDTDPSESVLSPILPRTSGSIWLKSFHRCSLARGLWPGSGKWVWTRIRNSNHDSALLLICPKRIHSASHLSKQNFHQDTTYFILKLVNIWSITFHFP